MESLPRELLKEITKNLPLNTAHAATLARASKFLNSSIWQMVEYIFLTDTTLNKYYDSINLDKFKSLERLILPHYIAWYPPNLSNLTTLNSLTISGEPTDRTVLKLLTNLRELSIALLKKVRTTPSVPDLLQDLSKLTSFTIHSTYLDTLDVFSWPFMTRVLDLTLSANGQPYSQDNYIEELWNLTQLRKLSLYHICLDLAVTDSDLSKLTNLEELTIYRSESMNAQNNNWLLDYNQLSKMSKLIVLSIYEESGWNEQYSKIIANMTQLVELEAPYNIIDAEVFSKLTNLTKLWFTTKHENANPCPDLQRLTKLRNLSLTYCPNLSNLVHLRRLQILWILEAEPTDELLDVLTQLTSLRYLTLSARTSSQSSMEEWRSRLPQLEELTLIN